jgi:hypothetical protein
MDCVSLMFACASAYMYVCLHVCMYACMYVCTYACVYVRMDCVGLMFVYVCVCQYPVFTGAYLSK